jgi:hypothetical protein
MSGENKGSREAMDRMVRQMVNHGTDHNYAKKKAREAAIKHDQNQDKKR